MKKLSVLLLAALMTLSILFIDSSAVKAAPAGNTPGQIVPKTKHITKRSYRKGRRITKTTYRHGRKITRKTWRKGKHIGRKVGRKTKRIVVGPPKRKP